MSVFSRNRHPFLLLSLFFSRLSPQKMLSLFKKHFSAALFSEEVYCLYASIGFPLEVDNPSGKYCFFISLEKMVILGGPV